METEKTAPRQMARPPTTATMPEKKKKPEEAMRKQDVLEKAIEQIQKERAAKKLKASSERVPEDI